MHHANFKPSTHRAVKSKSIAFRKMMSTWFQISVYNSVFMKIFDSTQQLE